MRKLITYDISELVPYINWVYYYFAWQIRDRKEQDKLRREAEQALSAIEGRYRVHAVLRIETANSDGDDIILGGDIMLPMLRQQQEKLDGKPNLCLADFIRPLSSGKPDRMALFATSVDIGMETDFDNDAYRKMMFQLLADRLAEAAAEKLHEDTRKTYWGYAPDEQLTMDELHAEKFQGIRPAVGYPSLPDTSLNFIIADALGAKDIGIRLTESGAMRPHASVSGLMIAHPQARYFSLGKIGNDQLHDYARRRNVPVEMMRRFLSASLR